METKYDMDTDRYINMIWIYLRFKSSIVAFDREH